MQRLSGRGARGTGPALSQEYSPMFVFLNLIAIAALVGIDQAIKLWASRWAPCP